jgi:antitoxin component YwqK of YwqJK toxin-antitoxin module
MKKQYLSFISLLFSCFLLSNCKTNRFENGKKQGKWVLTDTTNHHIYKHIEFYKKGEEVRTWKTFQDQKKYKVEKYKKGICLVNYYHTNGEIAIKGQTKQEVSEKEIHWFYFGDWLYYDEKGSLLQTKIYENGMLLNDFD